MPSFLPLAEELSTVQRDMLYFIYLFVRKPGVNTAGERQYVLWSRLALDHDADLFTLVQLDLRRL